MILDSKDPKVILDKQGPKGDKGDKDNKDQKVVRVVLAHTNPRVIMGFLGPQGLRVMKEIQDHVDLKGDYGTISGDVDMRGHRLTSLPTPLNKSDGATKK